MTEKSTSLGVTIQADEATLTKSGANIMSAKDNGITLAKLEHGTLGDLLLYGASGAPARLGVGARGDILFYNATTLAKLGVGSVGQFLRCGGAGADPTWENAGTMQKVAETIVSGSAVTSVDFTSLDMEADKNYLLLLVILNSSGSTTEYSLYYNDDTTVSNYDQAQSIIDGASIAGSRSDDAIIGSTTNGTMLHSKNFLSKIAGKRPITLGQFVGTTDPKGYSAFHQWTSTANVTKITITAADANGIGIGSRLTLFRLVS